MANSTTSHIYNIIRVSVSSSKILNVVLFSQLFKNRVAVVQQAYLLMTGDVDDGT